ncbi:bifunctional riboflavin kinase/FAD synthetase [Buchnera aphidicola (Acyrthosiphon lactucae)]|uniref:Riboflavin biosynthesis protein n=1 Tax=Buchnera aphidicola (Acyrthosiphon lactucae) TaxID=1241832 RepID=A0A4D6XRK3_9GAMM|nr:bifunctional riboflavin kinase/FAD synthetase [Buchnera aphidicola]QCI17557.1 bifunctional riboflavin kinase/FAD synthetase [Buchnera aphidicola (Acyrthosiphon lactucae)]
MKIIRGIHNIKEINSDSVITIGNFDGVHLGHQELFFNTYKIGKKYKLSTIIILFEPQPLEFLKKNNAPIRITQFREKVQRIASYNLNYILCIRFNKSFECLSAEDFIINILINKLNVKFIVIGDDFRFGFQKNGNINLLKKLGNKYQFNVIKVSSLYKNNIKISSTNIRKALSENNIELASLLLGRKFSISGKVIHGNAIGRTINYPTANILLNKNFPLINGVYAVKIRYCSNKNATGISNIGVKPSFCNTEKNKLLEVYLFNIEIDLYGQDIEVFIYKKIRDEKIFISKKELKNQIFKDIVTVKKYFKIY